jgi:O-antigen ligase/polysaccharide polymerase Wzy-like membrane protein
MTYPTEMPETKPQGAIFNPGFLIFTSISLFALAVLLAVVLQSTNVFLFVLCAAILPLVGTFYPPIVLALFLISNLLVPKLPLIPIKGYMVPIRIEDVLLSCALVSLLLRRLFFKEKSAPNLLRGWMVAFCVVSCLSFLFGFFILGSVPGAKIGFLFWLRTPEYFAAIYLCLLGVTNWKQYRQMMVTLVVTAALIGVYGILQELSLVPIFNAMHQDSELVSIQFFPGFGAERLFSTFAGPYDLAGFYLMAIPVFVGLFVMATSHVAKLLLASVLGLSLFCFYLTYARNPLAALIVVLAVCLWLLGKRSWGLILALLCVVPALLFGGFAERLRSAVDDPLAYYSLGGRWVLGWANALASVARSPLLGTGPASLSEDRMGVDGLYFMLVGMWGIVGLLCFLALIGKAIHYQRDCIRTSRNKMQRALSIGLFAGTFGLLVNGLTIDTFFSSKIALSYWFLMGLLLAGRWLENPTHTEERKPLTIRMAAPSKLQPTKQMAPAVGES